MGRKRRTGKKPQVSSHDEDSGTRISDDDDGHNLVLEKHGETNDSESGQREHQRKEEKNPIEDESEKEDEKEEEEEAIADVLPSSDQPDPLLQMLGNPRALFGILLGYLLALILAVSTIALVIITMPRPDTDSLPRDDFLGEDQLRSTVMRIVHSVRHQPVASLNVVIIYVILPFVISVGTTKGGIALLRAFLSWMAKEPLQPTKVE